MKMNQIVSEQIVPVIGMGATICSYSDREAATIIQVTNNGKRIVLQVDQATRTDTNGMSEMQTYSFKEDLDGKIFIATMRKDGGFMVSNTKRRVSIGQRNKYYDFSF